MLGASGTGQCLYLDSCSRCSMLRLSSAFFNLPTCVLGSRKTIPDNEGYLLFLGVVSVTCRESIFVEAN